MWRPLLLLMFACPLSAQYFDFAVTDNGTLYFATLLSAGPGNSHLKTYRLTDRVPELFASGGGDDNDFFGPTASMPLVSGDGSITGWALNYPCRNGSCGLSGLPRTFFQLQGVDITDLPYFFLQVSRNGRFLFGYSFDGHVRLIELPSKRMIDIGQSLGFSGPQGVANSGAVLLQEGAATNRLLYRPPDGEPRAVAGSEDSLGGVLSPAGDRIAYERNRGGRFELVLTTPDAVAETVLASAAVDPAAPRQAVPFRYQPSFANDGTLLYLDPGNQPFLVVPGAAPQPLATVENGVQRAILSGNGRIAWLESSSGQLLRARIGEGVVEEVIPATPYLLNTFQPAVPGSVIRLSGTGLSAETHLQLGDVALNPSQVTRQSAAAQIPWEFPAGSGTRTLLVQGPGNPFRQQLDVFLLASPTITFERDLFNQGLLQAAHQDFHGLVTAGDPARPGETLHVFARNLGPVDRPVATGERSPDSPPARATTPLACYLFRFQENSTPVNAVGLVVPFAGLTAGAIGVYHIDVTIPANWTAADSYLQCQMDSGDTFFHGDSSRLPVAVTR